MTRLIPLTHVFSQKKSLLVKAIQIFALLLLSSTIAILSSIQATKALRGDAALINQSGALRMQATRVSRAMLSANVSLLDQEKAIFSQHFLSVRQSFKEKASDNSPSLIAYQYVENAWLEFEQNSSLGSIKEVDEFVEQINRFVLLLEKESEKKVGRLYWIQWGSLSVVVIVGLFLVSQLRRHFVRPIQELAEVAVLIGKGDFSIQVNHHSENEIGVLALAIEQMKQELSNLYNDLETRVAEKTQALSQSNQSLKLLYKATQNMAVDRGELSLGSLEETLSDLVPEGQIRISLEFPESEYSSLSSLQKDTRLQQTNQRHELTILPFNLSNGEQNIGTLFWELPYQVIPEPWQIDLVKAFCEIVVARHEIEQKRLAKQRLLISEERAVIARELHDSLAQSLSFIKLQLGILNKLTGDLDETSPIRNTQNDMREAVNRAYTQLRELLTTFRLKLNEPSLEASLRASVIEFQTKIGHPIEFDYSFSAFKLNTHQEVHLLHIIREALSNIHRHANSTAAGVKITSQDKQLSVVIWDNGVGLADNTAERQGHFGIGIMNERAKELGCTINLKKNQPCGTMVCFDISLTN